MYVRLLKSSVGKIVRVEVDLNRKLTSEHVKGSDSSNEGSSDIACSACN